MMKKYYSFFHFYHLLITLQSLMRPSVVSPNEPQPLIFVNLKVENTSYYWLICDQYKSYWCLKSAQHRKSRAGLQPNKVDGHRPKTKQRTANGEPHLLARSSTLLAGWSLCLVRGFNKWGRMILSTTKIQLRQCTQTMYLASQFLTQSVLHVVASSSSVSYLQKHYKRSFSEHLDMLVLLWQENLAKRPLLHEKAGQKKQNKLFCLGTATYSLVLRVLQNTEGLKKQDSYMHCQCISSKKYSLTRLIQLIG